MNKLLVYFLLFFTISLFICSKNTADGCSIFSERYFWYKHVKKTEKKWGTPIHLQLAFIKMESDFDWLAKPERLKLFKIIPYKRPTQVLLVIHKLLKVHGNNTKKKIIDHWLPEQDLKIV